MGDRLAADTVLLLHCAFVLFAVLGATLVLRWPKLAWAHVPAALWASAVELFGWVCPLTPLETGLRQAAGGAGYSGGFVEHYLVPALYRSGLTREIQFALGLAVLGLNIAIYLVVIQQLRVRRRP
jgi:hypothetical protein